MGLAIAPEGSRGPRQTRGRDSAAATAPATGLSTAQATATRASITVQAATAPRPSARRGASSAWLLRAKFSVTDVDEINPPSTPATMIPRSGPTSRRASQAAKLRPEKNSTNAHSSRGRIASSGPYGPDGSSGRMMQAIAANRALARSAASSTRATIACRRVFSSSSSVVPAATALASARWPAPARRPGRDDHQRRHLRRGVDVVAAGGGIADRDQPTGRRHQDDGHRTQVAGRHPPGETGQRAEQREGANAAEAGSLTAGVARPLTLQADRRAGQHGHGEAGYECQIEIHSLTASS